MEKLRPGNNSSAAKIFAPHGPGASEEAAANGQRLNLRLLVDAQPQGLAEGCSSPNRRYPAPFQCLCLSVLSWGTIDPGQKFATWWK
jgi:hypothetical protein